MILIVAVWCAILIGVAIGPIDYNLQPSMPVLVLVATGIVITLVFGVRGSGSGDAGGCSFDDGDGGDCGGD